MHDTLEANVQKSEELSRILNDRLLSQPHDENFKSLQNPKKIPLQNADDRKIRETELFEALEDNEGKNRNTKGSKKNFKKERQRNEVDPIKEHQ